MRVSITRMFAKVLRRKLMLCGVSGVVVVGLVVGFLTCRVEPGLTFIERDKVKAAVGAQLNDPYSAYYIFRGRVQVPKRDERGQVVPADGEPAGTRSAFPITLLETPWYCGFVNAKNSFGAYTGNAYFAANVATGKAYVGKDAIGAAFRLDQITLEVYQTCTDTVAFFRDGKEMYMSRFDPNLERPAD